MVPIVDLVAAPDDQDTKIAQESLAKLKGVVDVQVYVCPPGVCERTIVPFVKDENGRKHSGIDGINAFVKQRLKQANS